MKREEFIQGLNDYIQLAGNKETDNLSDIVLRKIFGTKKHISCMRTVYNRKSNIDKEIYYLLTRSMKSTIHCLHHIIKHNCTIIEVRPRHIEFTIEEHDFSNVSYSD